MTEALRVLPTRGGKLSYGIPEVHRILWMTG
jgi:hypothetical protein